MQDTTKKLISNTDITTGSNRNFNKADVFHQNTLSSAALTKAHVSDMHLMKSSDDPIKETELPTDNQKMLVVKNNDEKLAVMSLVETYTSTYQHLWTLHPDIRLLEL